jgi:hypothetical protein
MRKISIVLLLVIVLTQSLFSVTNKSIKHQDDYVLISKHELHKITNHLKQINKKIDQLELKPINHKKIIKAFKKELGKTNSEIRFLKNEITYLRKELQKNQNQGVSKPKGNIHKILLAINKRNFSDEKLKYFYSTLSRYTFSVSDIIRVTKEINLFGDEVEFMDKVIHSIRDKEELDLLIDSFRSSIARDKIREKYQDILDYNE